jgi:hypothetical protein
MRTRKIFLKTASELEGPCPRGFGDLAQENAAQAVSSRASTVSNVKRN